MMAFTTFDAPNRRLSVVAVTNGVVGTALPLTTGDVNDFDPSFTADGNKVLFVRAGANTNAPMTLEVIGIDGSGQRTLATCEGNAAAMDLPQCVDPVMGPGGYVYYADQILNLTGGTPSLTLKRVLLDGSAPAEPVLTLDATCGEVSISGVQNRQRFLIALGGTGCGTPGYAELQPAQSSAPVFVARGDVTDVSFGVVRLDNSGGTMFVLGTKEVGGAFDTSLYSFTAANPTPTEVISFGTAVTVGKFVMHSAGVLVAASSWLGITAPATRTNFTGTQIDVSEFDWRP